jgi:hypothetical protein
MKTMNKPKVEYHRSEIRRKFPVPLGLLAVMGLCAFAYARGLLWGNIWSGRFAFQREADKHKLHKITVRVRIASVQPERSKDLAGRVLLIAAPGDTRLESRLQSNDIIMAFDDMAAEGRWSRHFRVAGGDVRWLSAGGESQVEVRNSEEVVMIAVSSLQSSDEPSREDLAIVGRFIIPAYDLLNGRRYRILKLSGGSRELVTIEL